MNRKMLSSTFPIRGLVGLSTCAFLLAIPAMALSEDVSSLNMTVPNVKGATLVGHMPGSTVLNFSVALQPSNQAALFAYADAVNDQRGINYHKFLSPSEVGAKFGASTSTVNAVTSYFTSKGLKVVLNCPNRMLLVFQGNASAVESAFNTKINLYSAPNRTIGLKSFYSYTTVPKLSKTLASNVVTVGGLQTAFTPIPMNTATPAQFRTLYNTAPLYGGGRRGEGITIGIFNEDGYRLADAKTFVSSFGLPTPAAGAGTNITKVSIGGSDGETQVAEGEGDLDIDCLLAFAPLSNIIIYDAAGSYDSLALLARVIADNKVDLMSESYGRPGGDTAELTAESNLHATLAAMGVTYTAASGDDGASDTIIDISSGTNVTIAHYPAMDPNVLAVGGTVTDVNANGSRGSETGWDGSGGGWETFSASFNHKPVYQRQSIVTLPVPAGDYRFYPDVALSAAGSNLRDGRDTRGDNGVPFVLSYYIVTGGSPLPTPDGGGTSAASPTMAAGLGVSLQELKAQGAISVDGNGKYRLGRIQDFLYETVGQSPSVFYDVLGGDIGVLPNGSEGTGAAGWDFVTGLGAMNFTGFTNAYLANQDESVVAVPSAASLYSITTSASASLVLGTVLGGDASSLVSTDNVSYVIQSVKQPGVGQVAAATVKVPLQSNKVRDSAFVTLSMQIPTKSTGYLYLLNASTNTYDLVSTITGTGTMGTTTIPLDVEASTYISGSSNGEGGTVTALVRSLQPTRLGSSPFKMIVDQSTVTERVKKG